MNTIKASRLIASTLVVFLFSMCGHAGNPNEHYVQLSSTETQPASAAINEATFDDVNGISDLGSNKHNVTVHVDGIYFAMLSTQVGSVKQKDQASGFIDLWLNKEGVPVSFSNTRQSVQAGETHVMVTQAILSLKAGDTISVGFSATNPTLGLISIPMKNKEPTITSVNFSMYKLS